MGTPFATIYAFTEELNFVRVIYGTGVFHAEDRWQFAEEIIDDRLWCIEFGRNHMKVELKDGESYDGVYYTEITRAENAGMIEKIRKALVDFCGKKTEIRFKFTTSHLDLSESGVYIDQPSYLTLHEYEGKIVEWQDAPDDGLNWMRNLYDDCPGGLTEDERNMIGKY